MTRNKVVLSFISNDVARKVSFKKRKVGLLRKAEELSTLCGVGVCAIVCNPYDPMPVVWPNQEQAKKVVDYFLDLPDVDRNQKMLDHPSHLNERILKSGQQLACLQDNKFQKEMALMMYGIVAGEKSMDDINPMALNNLLVMIDWNVEDIYHRLSGLTGMQMQNVAGTEGGMQMQGAAPGLMGAAPRTYEEGSSSDAKAFDGPL